MDKIKAPSGYKIINENYTNDGSTIVEVLKEESEDGHVTSNRIRVSIEDDKKFNVAITFSIDNEEIETEFSANSILMLRSELLLYSKINYQIEVALNILKQACDMTSEQTQPNKSIDGKYVDKTKLSTIDELEGLQQGNNTFNEDEFLLDYVEWQKGNIHVSDYAKKYNMTVWELQDKLRENRLAISNIRR